MNADEQTKENEQKWAHEQKWAQMSRYEQTSKQAQDNEDGSIYTSLTELGKKKPSLSLILDKVG